MPESRSTTPPPSNPPDRPATHGFRGLPSSVEPGLRILVPDTRPSGSVMPSPTSTLRRRRPREHDPRLRRRVRRAVACPGRVGRERRRRRRRDPVVRADVAAARAQAARVSVRPRVGLRCLENTPSLAARPITSSRCRRTWKPLPFRPRPARRSKSSASTRWYPTPATSGGATSGPRRPSSANSAVKQFGPARSIVVDGKDIVRAGNGTLEAFVANGGTEILKVHPGPNQLVAVVRDWSAV